MNLNAPTSPFPVHQAKDDHDQQQHYHTFAKNQRIILSSSSSSSASSYRILLSPTIEDHQGYYDRQIRETLNHEAAAAAYAGGVVSPCNKVTSGLKFTLWKQPHQGDKEKDFQWMKRSGIKEDHKMESSSDLSCNTSPSPSPYNNKNNNNPIRVCTDCNTTKTPLWRSGPKGPKSLCNACGIRQRKARRAMAVAAAASGETTSAASYYPTGIKIKLQHKEKIGKNGHSPRFKKRCKMAEAMAATTVASSSSGNGPKKLNLEDFLISLSQSLSFQRVFPEDEKDAAILLMAISSGLVHG